MRVSLYHPLEADATRENSLDARVIYRMEMGQAPFSKRRGRTFATYRPNAESSTLCGGISNSDSRVNRKGRSVGRAASSRLHDHSLQRTKLVRLSQALCNVSFCLLSFLFRKKLHCSSVGSRSCMLRASFFGSISRPRETYR